jgi:hypothetical protein
MAFCFSDSRWFGASRARLMASLDGDFALRHPDSTN